jgi:hypothetical protein
MWDVIRWTPNGYVVSEQCVFEAAYTIIKKILVHVSVVTKVCICSHSP